MMCNNPGYRKLKNKDVFGGNQNRKPKREGKHEDSVPHDANAA
jgi:hypothetical protein